MVTITVRERWFAGVVWFCISHWLIARTLITRRPPTETETERVAAWFAAHCVTFRVE